MRLFRYLWSVLPAFHFVAAATKSKLLAGGTIVAFDKVSGLFDVIRNGSLLLEGGRIISIFDESTPPSNSPGTEIVDCHNKIITPGFVDTHRHGWQTAFKTLGSNSTLGEYRSLFSALAGLQLFTPNELYVSQLAGIYQAQAAGVTTMLDHAHHTWTEEHAAAGWDASVNSGARVFFGYAFMNTSTNFQVPQQMEHWRKLHASSPSNLATLCISYDYFSDNPESITKSVVDLAKESNVAVLTSHQVEGPWLLGNTPEDLYRAGILNSSIPVVISHSAFLTARGSMLLRNTNQYISITPESEMHYGHTHPSSHLILDQASLGVDTHFAFSADILSQARLWLQRVRERFYSYTLSGRWLVPDRNPMSVNQAFLLATRRGGVALKREDLGIIAVNATADIVVWDGRSPALLGWTDPIAAVILHASIGDIDHVIVNGNFVKRDKKIVIDGYEKIEDRFLEVAASVQAKVKALGFPPQVGSFSTGFPYGPVAQADVERGPGTGYGPSYA
ncbi:amidohydrolase [Nemania sp. FL0916]|nr:amidohydrolase [Nemania sp. FL0916]